MLLVSKEATSKWEKLRRHDTSEEERAELVALVLSQVTVFAATSSGLSWVFVSL